VSQDEKREARQVHSIPDVVHDKSGTSGELFHLAYPLMISFLSMTIMGLIDTFIVGYVGTAQQGGVGFAMNITWTMFSLFTGMMGAVVTFVAQAYGAGRIEQIKRWVMVAFTLSVPSSLIIFAAIPFASDIIDLIGTEEELRPHVVTYMTIMMLGVPFLLSNFIFSGFFRALGDTRTPMVVTIIANVINAGLAVLLVFGCCFVPAMGVSGAATATVFAQACQAVVYLYVYVNDRNNTLYGTRSLFIISASELGRFLKLGLPMGMAWSIEMVSWAFMMSLISRMGAASMAASTIVWQLMHFSFMPTVALSIAISTLVGQYLGAERIDLARRSAKIGLVWGLSFMFVLGAIFAIGRNHFIAIFNADPEVVATGSTLLLIAAAFQIFDALNICSSGVLRGAGDTRFPMYVQLGLAWMIFIPLVYVFGSLLEWGVYGAWMAGLVFIVLLGIAMFLRYAAGGWTKIRVIR